jgi:hypothetical protein
MHHILYHFILESIICLLEIIIFYKFSISFILLMLSKMIMFLHKLSHGTKACDLSKVFPHLDFENNFSIEMQIFLLCSALFSMKITIFLTILYFFEDVQRKAQKKLFHLLVTSSYLLKKKLQPYILHHQQE